MCVVQSHRYQNIPEQRHCPVGQKATTLPTSDDGCSCARDVLWVSRSLPVCENARPDGGLLVKHFARAWSIHEQVTADVLEGDGWSPLAIWVVNVAAKSPWWW